MYTVKILILKRYRYRPVTVFGPPLLTVTVFWPTLQTVTDRYHTVTIPFGTVPHRPPPSVTVPHRPSSFPTVPHRPLPLLSGPLVLLRTLYLLFFIAIFLNNAVN